MVKRKVFILLCLFLFIVSLSAVSASEDVNQTIIDGIDDADTLGASLSDGEIVGSADNGTFTDLQKKINDADEGSTITLEKDYVYNSGFSTKGITIGKAITINGNGYTIDALGHSRIFYITSQSVTLNNITFKNGYSDYSGGAIYFDSDVSNCNISGKFINNAAANYGGAIYFNDNVYDSSISGVFINNTASYSGGATFFYEVYDSSISGVFINNTASSSPYNSGGAIRFFFEVYDSSISGVFINNTASDSGGAIRFTGGSDSSISGVFINNTAGSGGAINFRDGSDSSISGVFINNTAGSGGAINFRDGYDCNISGVFINNTASDSGGAIYFSLSDNCNISGKFINNTAGSGGAINFRAGSDSSISGVFINNTASKGSSYSGGGAICFTGGYDSSISGVFINNTARYGGAICFNNDNVYDSSISGVFINNTAKYYGGAIYFSLSDNCNISGEFINNAAGDDGGAIYFDSDVSNCNISGKFINNAAAEDGGAIYFRHKIHDSSIIINSIVLDSISPWNHASVNTWFGNNASNYENNVNCKSWLFLNASSVPVTGFNGKSSVTFTLDNLYDSSSNVITHPDISDLPDVVFELSAVNGYLDKYYARPGESVIFTATGNGDGIVKATYGGVSYSIVIVNLKIDTLLTAEDVVAMYNDDSRLIAELKDVNGNPISGAKVKFTIGNLTKTMKTYTSGKAFISTKSLAPGSYIATVTFDGDDNYAPASATANVLVKMSTVLTAEDVAVVYQDASGKWVVALKDASDNPISGVKVKLTVGDLTKTMKTYASGKAFIGTKTLAPGDYVATVTFDGDDYYAPASATAKVTVKNKKLTTVLTAEDTVVIYADASGKWVVALKDASGNPISGVKVKLTVGDLTKTMRTLSSGKAYIGTKSLDIGDYVATVTFDGDDYYAPASATAKVTVKNNKLTTVLTAKDAVVVYQDASGKWVVTLKDSDGNPISDVKVKLTVGDLTKTMRTLSSGKAYIGTKTLAPGEYVATVSYDGDDNYAPSNATANVLVKMGTVLTAEDVVATSGDSSRLIVELKDTAGNPISGVKVKFKIGDLTKSMNTYSNGKAFISTKSLAPGNYTAVISCAGNEDYAASSTTANVIIKQA